MGADPPRKKESSGGSFWTSGPGILTGVAAVITAIGGLVATLHGAGLIQFRRSPPPPPVVQPPASGTEAVVPPPDGGEASTDGCRADYFKGIPRGRIVRLEAGVRDFDFITPQQPKEQPIGLKFTDNGQPIGAMRFTFIEANQIFKVESVVDARCRSIETLKNTSRGGDPHTLQNWDSLKFVVHGHAYELRLGYADGEIGANYFQKVSP